MTAVGHGMTRIEGQKLAGGQEGFCRVSEDAWWPDTLILVSSGLQNCEGLHFCCFKPPGLWNLITTALGNEQTPVFKNVWESLRLARGSRRLITNPGIRLHWLCDRGQVISLLRYSELHLCLICAWPVPGRCSLVSLLMFAVPVPLLDSISRIQPRATT